MNKRTIFEMLNIASVKYADKPYLSQKDDNGWVFMKIKLLLYHNQKPI
jgi:hypothetical protein